MGLEVQEGTRAWPAVVDEGPRQYQPKDSVHDPIKAQAHLAYGVVLLRADFVSLDSGAS